MKYNTGPRIKNNQFQLLKMKMFTLLLFDL